ncbi:MAG: lipopolysaccharide biosynthesis protein [Lachnospiraceae bacterium]|nr:lipopolysaccharide biosynthesis protein [Lachnospiraceae bacterium]
MDIQSSTVKASKWSLMTEIATKLISPIVNMILARLIAPEAFGMVATITMITSFADIFTDAGFQKYIIQRDVIDEEDLNKDTNVAFWTNLTLSCFIWIIIFLFRDGLANAVGNSGLGNAIAIAALTLPLTSFSSIQMARYRRSFDFKTLFFVKIIEVIIPVFVTVPLAFIIRSFWAIILGNICVNLANAVILTTKSEWKPSFFYSISKLRQMIGFSIWTLMEQLLGWANLNVGIFIVGKYLSDYYLGLYKTSMVTTNQVLMIFVNAFSPVLLAALSRMKDCPDEFNKMFYSFISKLAFIVIPLGVGIFIYSNLFTSVMLGSQWSEAAEYIGLLGLVISFHFVFGYFSMEVFISLGKPIYSVLTQVLCLAVLLPVLLFAATKGYTILCYSRCIIVLWSVIVDCVLMKKVAGISTVTIIRNIIPSFIATFIMAVFGIITRTIFDSTIWDLFTVVMCIILYFVLMYIYPKTRKIEMELINLIKR